MQGAPPKPSAASGCLALAAGGGPAGRPLAASPLPKTPTNSKQPGCFFAEPGDLGGPEGRAAALFAGVRPGPHAGEPRGRFLGGQGKRDTHHPGEVCCCVSSRGRKKKKKSYFLLRQSEGSHSPSHEKRRLAKIRGNWRHKPVCGDRGFKDPAALHRPPCPPLFPPSPHPHSAKKCCREGQATIPLPTCLLPLKKLPQRLWPPGINGQAAGAAMPPGAGRVRAQPSAVIRPGLRWRRAGARALTSPSTINLPSASPFSF